MGIPHVELEFTYGSLSSTRMMVHNDCMQLLDDCRSDTQEFHTVSSVRVEMHTLLELLRHVHVHDLIGTTLVVVLHARKCKPRPAIIY